MGAEEVGGEALVEALATLMPGPDWTDLAEAARQAEYEGTLDGWLRAGTLADPLTRLETAGAQETAAARTTAQMLAGVGALYLMYGLLMPDTPALAALREQLDAPGFGLIVAQLAPMMTNPSGVPHDLALCLAPETRALAAWLGTLLIEQATIAGGLLRLPGAEQGEAGAEAFMRAWTDHIHHLTDRPRTGAKETAGDVGAKETASEG
ncbi:hypothetical protein [Streptomyces sp. NPDC059928]|uniref:hypothetical protein n=1 Tax=unclassified Streptomyces TaxID=2593676 RepID=UPI00366348F5